MSTGVPVVTILAGILLLAGARVRGKSYLIQTQNGKLFLVQTEDTEHIKRNADNELQGTTIDEGTESPVLSESQTSQAHQSRVCHNRSKNVQSRKDRDAGNAQVQAVNIRLN